MAAVTAFAKRSFLVKCAVPTSSNAFACSSRCLATVAENLPSSSTSSSAVASDPSPMSHSENPVVSSSPITTRKVVAYSLFQSPPQIVTPYHAYVHVPVLSLEPKPKSELPPLPDREIIHLPASLFNTTNRPALLHRLVRIYRASLRRGNAHTKSRGEVSYSGAKVRPQKGTGRARLGDATSPMLKGGGTAFGPQRKGPDGWTLKLNAKEHALGIRVALSQKWRSGNLCVVDRLGFPSVDRHAIEAVLAKKDWLNATFILADDDKLKSAKEIIEQDAFEKSVRDIKSVAVYKRGFKNPNDVVHEQPKKNAKKKEEKFALTIWDLLRRRKVVIELSVLDQVIEFLDPGKNWEQTAQKLEENFEAILKRDFEQGRTSIGQSGVELDTLGYPADVADYWDVEAHLDSLKIEGDEYVSYKDVGTEEETLDRYLADSLLENEQ